VNTNLLPSGTWLRISNLPPGTTEEDLHEFLKAHGLDCGADCFSVKHFDNGTAGAIFSVPDEMLPALIKWALGGGSLQGRQLDFRNWKALERGRRRP